MSPETIAVGVFSILGTLLGGVLGLFGERLVRRWGEVRCEIVGWDAWVSRSRPGGGGAMVTDRLLHVAFLNRKEVDVTVWDMRVVFYRGGKHLEDWESPHIEFAIETGAATGPIGPVHLPSRLPVTKTIKLSVDTKNAEKVAAVEEADKAEFVAKLVGARNITKELQPPWRLPA